MSDGCTVPKALRLVIPQETPAQVLACVEHDAAYYEGGTRRMRAVADAHLLLGLLENGMDVDLAERYHTAVRIFGKPHWDNGGGRYSDEPPEDPRADPPSPESK